MKKIIDKVFDSITSTVGAIIVLVLIFALIFGIAFGILCFEGWLLMLLWNAVIPAIFVGAPTLSFWLAVGLILICNILFKTVVRNKSSD